MRTLTLALLTATLALTGCSDVNSNEDAQIKLSAHEVCKSIGKEWALTTSEFDFISGLSSIQAGDGVYYCDIMTKEHTIHTVIPRPVRIVLNTSTGLYTAKKI